MTTLTLKIKEKTKKGRIFLDLAKLFYDDKNEVSLIEKPVSKKIINTEISSKDKKYLTNLKKVVLDIKSGNQDNLKTWKEFANEI